LKVATSRLINQVPGEVLRLEQSAFLELVSQCPGTALAPGSLYGGDVHPLFPSRPPAIPPLAGGALRTAGILMTTDRVDADTFPLTPGISVDDARRPAGRA